MATMTGPLVAGCDVIANGTPLSAGTLDYLMEIIVDQSVDLPSMFSLLLASSDAQSQPSSWIDDPSVFAIGDAMEIKIGYNDNLATLIHGEVTSLEPEFSASHLPRLRVRGYDRRHRLQRGRKTKSFLKQKDSEIASAIGSGAGLTVDAKDSDVTHDYVLQANQTDWEFLCERASRISYEVLVDDKKMSYRPVANDGSPVLTLDLELGSDLIEFHPRLSTGSQPSNVTVQGWDVKQKQAFTASSTASDLVSQMSGDKNASRMVQSAFGASPEVLTSYPVAAQAEADAIAKACMNEAGLEFISGDGICLGNTSLCAGKVIQVAGIGKRFSGDYYVTNAIHRFTAALGYLTEFTVRRTAS
jgi:phage protein D